MLLYLEGPDKAGKTTFGERLSAHTGWPFVRRTFPPNPSEDYFFGGGTYLAWTYRAIAAKHLFTLILDRSFASSYAYHADVTMDKIMFWAKQLPADTRFLLFTVRYPDYLQRIHRTSVADLNPLPDRAAFEEVTERYLNLFRVLGLKWTPIDGIAPFVEQLHLCRSAIPDWPKEEQPA